jgi:hypothetical protein
MASLNAKIPDDLKTELDVATARRGMTIQDATIEALTAWLRAVSGLPQQMGTQHLGVEGDKQSWPRDVRDGEELVREFVAMLKHPGPYDSRAIRTLFIDHLRDEELRRQRHTARKKS